MIIRSGFPQTRHFIFVCIIAVLCSIIYSNTLNVPFVFDDLDNILDNRHIRLTGLDLAGLYEAAFKSLHPARPLANISFALNYYFGKYEVTGYHLVNIAIHLINGILVYFLVLLTFRQLHKTRDNTDKQIPEFSIALVSLFAASIFVAHPVQVQSVTYIVQRMNSLAAMFYFLALLLFITGRLAEIKSRRLLLWSGCLGSWVLALGCKQTAATLPLIILLYEWFFFQDLNREWIRKNAGYLVGTALLLVFISVVYLGDDPLERILASYKYREFTIGERLLTQSRVIVYYLSLLIVPAPSRLNLLPDFTLSHSLFDPLTTFLSLLVLAGLIISAICFARQQRLISFCIFWFFINLGIESSVIGLEIIFEHRLYLPMFAFAMAAGYLVSIFPSERLILYSSCMLVIIIVLGTATYSRNKAWTGVVTLWADVVSKNPHSYRAHYNLGKSLQNEGMIDQAIIHYYKAISLKPLHAGAHNNLGIALIDKKLYAEAASHFNKVIEINPLSADAHANLGVALEKLNRHEDAINHYAKALQINHAHVKAHYLIGSALQEQGKPEQAKYHLTKTLELKPDQPMAHNNLGVILIDQGKVDDAIVHFSNAIRLNPRFAFAYFNLAYAQRLSGNIKTACSNYRTGLKLKPDFQPVKEDIARYCGLP